MERQNLNTEKSHLDTILPDATDVATTATSLFYEYTISTVTEKMVNPKTLKFCVQPVMKRNTTQPMMACTQI
jgi:hypothetical protein